MYFIACVPQPIMPFKESYQQTMKKYILFTLTAVVTLCLMSCIDEDDFIQEGNLRVEFTNDIYIRHDEKVTIYVMDIRGNEKLHAYDKVSYGKIPIEINGINVGTYRIAMKAEYAGIDTKDVQIRKGQTAVVKFW